MVQTKTSKSHSEIIWPLATWNFKIVATLRDIQHNNHCFYNLDSFPLEHSCDWVGYSMINWVKGKSIRVHNLSWHYDFGHGCLCKRCYSAMLWFGKKFGWFLQIISNLIKAVKQLMDVYLSPTKENKCFSSDMIIHAVSSRILQIFLRK